ncbi:MAG: hypothetical protein JW986_01890 [Methanotrichaceae archaeon]|nr:hypothetical protein [Methanotrichaceae archaeon]
MARLLIGLIGLLIMLHPAFCLETNASDVETNASEIETVTFGIEVNASDVETNASEIETGLPIQAAAVPVPEGAIDLGSLGSEKYTSTHMGSLGYPGDEAWFEFEITEPVRAILVASSPDGSLAIVLFDEDMSFITSAGSMLNEEMDPGTYYLRLGTCPYEEANYSIILTNSFEIEPNDGISDAQDLGEISESQLIGGSILPSGDVDFFKFEMPSEQGAISIQAETDGNTPALILYAMDADAGRYLPVATGSSRIIQMVNQGSYYLRVQGDGRSYTFNYTLNISQATWECDDEPNDEIEEAAYLGEVNLSSALEIDGCISKEGDEDYYAFDLTNKSKVVIETSGDDGDSMICLYDAEEDEVGCDDDDGEGLWSLMEEELDPGRYFVKVESYYGDATFSYKLSISVEE